MGERFPMRLPFLILSRCFSRAEFSCATAETAAFALQRSGVRAKILRLGAICESPHAFPHQA
jgi:hypothetical protein